MSVIENVGVVGDNLMGLAIFWLLIGLMGLACVLLYFHFKYRNRLFAKIIEGSGGIDKMDITDKLTGFERNKCHYIIDRSRVVRDHPIIPRNAIYYLKNCPKPIWWSAEGKMLNPLELRPTGYELNNMLRANLSDLLKTGTGIHFPKLGKWIVVGFIVFVIFIVIMVALGKIGGGPPAITPV